MSDRGGALLPPGRFVGFASVGQLLPSPSGTGCSFARQSLLDLDEVLLRFDRLLDVVTGPRGVIFLADLAVFAIFFQGGVGSGGSQGTGEFFLVEEAIFVRIPGIE